MSETTTALKNKIEAARGDIYQILLSDPNPQLKLVTERADKTLQEFLEYDFPAIEEADKQ